MAISITNIGSNSTKANAATLTVAAVTVPAGSLICVALGGTASLSTTGSTVADTKNTYTMGSGHANAGSSGPVSSFVDATCALFYAWNCTALTSSDTITVNYQLTGSSPQLLLKRKGKRK